MNWEEACAYLALNLEHDSPNVVVATTGVIGAKFSGYIGIGILYSRRLDANFNCRFEKEE